jgi:transposase
MREGSHENADTSFSELGVTNEGQRVDAGQGSRAATIPERTDQQAGRRRRGHQGGRPRAFDPNIYRRRNVVERCLNRLKQWRGIATRCHKLACHYQAAVTSSAPSPGSTIYPPDRP